MNTRLPQGARLGLWRMDENVEQFSALGEVYRTVLGTYTSETRRKEVLCTYALLFALTGDTTLRISHRPSGQPVCSSAVTARTYAVSISHTVGWVAVIVSGAGTVAVDIEYLSPRVQRIASRFLRPDECFSSPEQLLICWCAKETAYKYFSSQHLAFHDMRVLPFQAGNGACEGRVMLCNERCGMTVDICYQKNSRYVLTFMTGC